MHTPLYWTEKRVLELRKHVEASLSGGAIAAEMGVTRNVIIGKCARLKLTLKGSPNHRPRLSEAERDSKRKEQNASRVIRMRTQRQQQRGERKVKEPNIQFAAPLFVGSLNIPFSDLRPWSGQSANQCRFIAVDAVGKDAPACGNETLPGESWCGHCKDIVFSRAATLVPQKVAA